MSVTTQLPINHATRLTGENATMALELAMRWLTRHEFTETIKDLNKRILMDKGYHSLKAMTTAVAMGLDPLGPFPETGEIYVVKGGPAKTNVSTIGIVVSYCCTNSDYLIVINGVLTRICMLLFFVLFCWVLVLFVCFCFCFCFLRWCRRKGTVTPRRPPKQRQRVDLTWTKRDLTKPGMPSGM